MSVGNWMPENAQGANGIDRKFLDQCIDIARRGTLEQLPELVSDHDQALHRAIAQRPSSEWTSALQDFSSEELRLLIRFFVRAEKLLPGWEAGERSPAIWINKVIKSRGERLDQEELLWIRANTDNRFIPNGQL